MSNNSELKPVLKIKNLKTHFFLDTGTIKAVDGINLTINKGKTLGIIGESGCGKSVTAHSILKLIPSPIKLKTRIAITTKNAGVKSHG